jgi:DNA-binding transcriptional regulator YiaG
VKKKYQSKMLQVIHEDMKGMHDLGIISDAEMREFDEECLVQEPEPSYKSTSSARTVYSGSISAKGAD